MRFDDHQQAIIDLACQLHAMPREHRQPHEAIVNIQAVAGAGKSVIITELTRRLSDANFLFLCKSDNIAARARASLPPSVEINTFHQAAYAFVSQTHAIKIPADALLPDYLSDGAIRQATDLEASPQDTLKIRRALSFFYTASAPRIEESHIDEAIRSFGETPDPGKVSAILSLTRRVWASQTQRTKGTAPICKGAATKLWTLGRNTVTAASDSGPGTSKTVSLSPLGEADVIVIEEAQDLDDAIIGFIGRQNRVLLMFGDSMQSLEPNAPFRNQDHPLQQKGHAVTLARSYRFGGELPQLLDALRQHDTPQHDDYQGHPSRQTQLVTYTPDALTHWIAKESPVTVVAASVTDLLTLTLFHPRISVAWVDGLLAPHYHFKTLCDLACLLLPADSPQRKRIHSQAFRHCADIYAAQSLLARRNARHALMLCEWVLANSHIPLFDHLQQLYQQDTRYQHRLVADANAVTPPALTLATVRAAKGHEWSTVAITDGMAHSLGMHLSDDTQRAQEAQRQRRWLYTAISRATHTVMIPSPLSEYLAQQGHRYTMTPPDEANLAATTNQDHPYFGLSHLRVLEMSPEAKAARRLRFARSQRQRQRMTGIGQRPSGQNALKQEIERNAKQYSGMTASDHLQSLKKLTSR